MKNAFLLLLLSSSIYPAGAQTSLGSDLYAYYTRLDYRIPLSDVQMDVPFARREDMQSDPDADARPEVPSDVPQLRHAVLKIGAASPNFGGWFEGEIDTVCIYNRKLNGQEVAHLAQGELVQPGPSASYGFDGSTEDTAGGKPAILHGGAKFSSDNREGSHALQFDGHDQWVQSPVKAQPHGAFTWTAWIKTHGGGTIISHCNLSGPWHTYGRCFFIQDGKLVYDVGWVGRVEQASDISDDRWHHVAVAGAGGLKGVDLYVDGKPVRTGPAITGKYADVVVHVDNERRLVFGREASYCPLLETSNGRFPCEQLVECRPDPMCLCSYVRIIKSTPQEVLVHWRHVPDPQRVATTEEIHELFTVTPDGVLVRQVKVGTQRLEDFEDPANGIVQKLQLTQTGIQELSLSRPGLSGRPGEAIDGSAVKEDVVGAPAAWFKFDEGLCRRAVPEKYETREHVGKAVCTISGNKILWRPGVSGTALVFDGYFSKVTLPKERAPRVTDELTLEAWVVLGAYPWNDAGIVHQSTGQPISADAYKHGYQDPYVYRPWEMEGYMLGVDPYGRPIFKINDTQVGGGNVEDDETVRAESGIPTYRWTHLAGVYGNGKMALYWDGKLVDQRAASGAICTPYRDVLVGLNGDPQRVSDPVSHSEFAANNNLPIVYGIEGLIDEVRIYDHALSDEQIRESYTALLPPPHVINNPHLERRILPGQVTGEPGNRFGASYETLTYHEIWDNLWRPSLYRDIVVRFDALPTSVVFWQGTNFGSGWVTENNRWMSDQSCEIGGPHGCAEHMADKRGRFGHVRLIENTDARVLVHWRYPSIDVGYVFSAPDVWVDEYYTIYPDGVGIRHVARGKGGWHDTQFLTQAGTTCLDHLSLQALTVASLDGESRDLRWALPNRVPRNPIEDACIKVVNFKSNWKVFAIYREGAKIEQWGHSEQSKHTPDPFAGPWNHWPVGLNPSDGRYAVAHDRVTHAAIGGADNVGTVIMYGFTDGPATGLIPLAKSWNRPPTIEGLQGGQSRGYQPTERAYRLISTASGVSFTLDGSEETPIYNPCFVIENWTGKAESRLAINGAERKPGRSFRQGVARNTDGMRMLLIWVEFQASAPVHFAVESTTE